MMIERGSEWRRWELHLHTPFTKKNDNYSGNNEVEKWNNFYSTISDYIGDGSDPLRSICAIAITDYLSVDNYFKVVKDNRLPKSVMFVFPNVEMRMKPIAKTSPINIHCLFSPDIADDLEERFFSKLSFEYQNIEYSATKKGLISLGKAFIGDRDITENEAIHYGIEQYVISFEVLSNIFKKDTKLKEKTIIAVSNGSKDGASGLRSHSEYFVRDDGNISQLEATRRSIYQLSDAVFSSNVKDVNYFLGLGEVDDEQAIKKKCGSLKPCIHGCDAHSNEKIFAPDYDNFCWIKAEPTFEGLKQILYEPKERIRICKTFPDPKVDYYVIDRVEIKGNPDFSEKPIYFNDKLTCIIGGKSTGKSLLLHNIALAIDKEQVNKKQETVRTNVKDVPELNVFWRDGVCSKNKDKKRKIVYIPQTYLNRLSDDEEETTEIDTIIQDIVLQEDYCYEQYQILNKNISEIKQQIAKTIVDFVGTIRDINNVMNQCKNIGDRNSINEEINKMCSLLDKLSKEYNVTENEIKEYQSAVEDIQVLKNKLNLLKKERGIIFGISSVIEVKTYENYDLINCKNVIDDIIVQVKKYADDFWCSKRNELLSNIDEEINKIQNTISSKLKIIANLQPKMEGNEQISKISNEIVRERTKLEKLINMENQLENLKKLYNKYLEILSNSFETFSVVYSEYVSNINESFKTNTEDLEFLVKKVLRTEQISKKFTEILNKKSFRRFEKISNFEEIKESDLTSSNIKSLIESILINSNESLQLKNSYSLESGLREILTDWYNLDYVVKMDGDSIQEMSPGKKALVLLRLLISLAESKCPILIDQPEDDLDNRSIFNELIEFIKKKKIDRQIITVTHNANIVLGGDAELVIVANQNGKNVPNEKYRFEYRSGAIENDSSTLNKEEINDHGQGILNSKSIQEHICEILEGGERAFSLRRNKYHFNNT